MATDFEPAAAAASDPATAGGRERSRRDPRRDPLATLIPILLAVLGLTAALIAWQIGVASSNADDANRAGLDAARLLGATQVVDESITTRTLEAYLDYERARRRAEALAAAGFGDEAQLDRMIATAHWFLVAPEFLGLDGEFQPEAQRQALIAAAAEDQDLDPTPHFAAAEASWTRIEALILAGIIVALALPFLALAEVSRGRPRIGGAAVGTAILVVGVGLTVAALTGVALIG